MQVPFAAREREQINAFKGTYHIKQASKARTHKQCVQWAYAACGISACTKRIWGISQLLPHFISFAEQVFCGEKHLNKFAPLRNCMEAGVNLGESAPFLLPPRRRNQRQDIPRSSV